MASTSPEFRIIPASTKDIPRVQVFIREAFYKYEPINVSMGVNEEATKQDEQDTVAVISEGKSLLAESDGGTLVGTLIAGEISADDADAMQRKADECACPRYKKVLNLLAKVERESEVWKKTGARKGVSIQLMAVDPAVRGKGVGLALTERARDDAKEQGYDILVADCTSYFSYILTRKIGMESIYSLPFSEFKDENGVPVFNPPEPHKDVKVCVLKLK